MSRLRIDRLTGPPAPLVRGDGSVVAGRCHRAASAVARAVGLLGTPDLAGHEALWIERCSNVHALGLRAPIGCAFLDAEGRVLRIVDPLPRNRIAGCRGAAAVVECRAGVLRGDVALGDRLAWGDQSGAPPGPGCATQNTRRNGNRVLPCSGG